MLYPLFIPAMQTRRLLTNSYNTVLVARSPYYPSCLPTAHTTYTTAHTTAHTTYTTAHTTAHTTYTTAHTTYTTAHTTYTTAHTTSHYLSAQWSGFSSDTTSCRYQLRRITSTTSWLNYHSSIIVHVVMHREEGRAFLFNAHHNMPHKPHPPMGVACASS